MDLISQLPSTVNIEGVEVEINTDFRTSIQFEELLKEDIEKEEFWNKALKLYYPIMDQTIMTNELEKIKLYNHIIDNSIESTGQIIWFHRCGKEEEQGKEQSTNKDEIVSYEHDAGYIYSAFLDQYGMNIKRIEYLHWWEFKAMFRGLKEDNKLSEIMSIRARETSKLPKEMQDMDRKLKKIYAIPRKQETVKRNNGIAELLRSGKDLSNLKE